MSVVLLLCRWKKNFIMRREREREEKWRLFSIFCSFVFGCCFLSSLLRKRRRERAKKENRDISMRARARRHTDKRTGTMVCGSDVVFYASVIVVVILICLSRDASRRYCRFFLWPARVACSKHRWCSMHSCAHTHTRTHTHTHKTVVVVLVLLPPPFSFSPFSLPFQFEQLFGVLGKRARRMEEVKGERKGEREREGATASVRTIGRQIERRRERESERANPLFVLFWHSLSPPMIYVRERDVVNVSHANAL